MKLHKLKYFSYKINYQLAFPEKKSLPVLKMRNIFEINSLDFQLNFTITPNGIFRNWRLGIQRQIQD